MRDVDFIIIGAGSAGCVLANRLSEDGQNSVLVVEYGGSDVSPFIQMPAAFSIPMNTSRYDWGYRSEAEPHLGGRSLACPRGKVIGGSSSINGMVYVRGHPQDFDTWQEMGAEGWGYADVAPYFQRLETSHGGEDGWRGSDGPMHVTRGMMRNPLYSAFIRAGAEAGYPLTFDYNGSAQEGFGPMEMTVWRGQRWSSAQAYLRPALKRANVELMSNTLAERILFEDRRAVGLVVSRGGARETIRARREIIVAASSINSPKLLMLSGIGPAEHLREEGIDVVADRPGVGGNLQDHLEVYVQQECRKPVTLNPHLGLVGRGRIGTRWLLTRTGFGATNHFEACAFIRSAPGVAYPDLQMHFLPAAVRYDGSAAASAHGYQIHIGPMRSPSRGSVRLNGPDAATAPAIRFNYMSHEQDWRDFRAAIRLAREIFAQPAFGEFSGAELAPGPGAMSDAALDDFVRSEVESAYHPCGTCRMGAADDVGAVVDPQCRVIGVDGLRVADSSIFPQITNGNLNAPSLMVGEKAADHILGRSLLPRFEREPVVVSGWAVSQRSKLPHHDLAA
ncbi:choline dehydrogenase [Afifella sp. H1R]|uniref:choline dehydrogenase n=1 Tax=Afifella sp. H1R TaxID=2908841 RepID=UPI001F2CD8B6|nr:choline dehydrogenase [Afifella sp. H1R]MCF1505341.1 choline dehydrogenase [Afifella sp. H1R]